MKAKRVKAQGSLEFLMTYSWALIILLVVFVVAWQMGFFSLSDNVEPGSYGFWGVTPMDFKMGTGGTLTLSVSNDLDANVTVNYVTGFSPTANVTNSGGWTLIPGQNTQIQISGLKTGNKGSRFDVFVIINYSNSKMQAGNDRLSSGSLWGSYE